MGRREFTQLTQSPFVGTDYGDISNYDYSEVVAANTESTANVLLSAYPQEATEYVTHISVAETGDNPEKVVISIWVETEYEGQPATLWNLVTTGDKQIGMPEPLPVNGDDTMYVDILNRGSTATNTTVDTIITEVPN